MFEIITEGTEQQVNTFIQGVLTTMTIILIAVLSLFLVVCIGIKIHERFHNIAK